jgi:hypothetical protein
MGPAVLIGGLIVSAVMFGIGFLLGEFRADKKAEKTVVEKPMLVHVERPALPKLIPTKAGTPGRADFYIDYQLVVFNNSRKIAMHRFTLNELSKAERRYKSQTTTKDGEVK